MAYAPLELADVELRVLFRHDSDGRLVAINEHRALAPPFVAVARTAEGCVVRTAAGTPQGLARQIAAALEALDPWTPGEPTPGLPAALATAAGLDAHTIVAGPAYIFRGPFFPGGAMQLYPANAHLLHPSLATLAPELAHRRPTFAVLRCSQAVSVCYSARASREAAEAGVETVPEYRGQGCAALAAESWADAIEASGRLAFYSTTWDNAASIALARKLGLGQYAELAWAMPAPEPDAPVPAVI